MLGCFFTTSLGAVEARRGAHAVREIGDIGQYVVPLGALAMVGIKKDFEGAKQYAYSFATTMALTYILKPTVNARRPDGGSMSFPSGHTAAAMAGAAFLQLRYGSAVGVPACLMAAYVGFSRVYAKRHWTRDVIGGAAIAVGANLLFTRRYVKGVEVVPEVTKDRLGVRVCWNW